MTLPEGARAMSRGHAWRLAGAVAGSLMAVDQATKQIAIGAIDRGESVNVFFGLDLVNVRNPGVAFGALSGGGWLVTLLTLAALSFLLGYFALRARTRALWIPVGAIVGGALGNLADRARDGAVIDFIDPAFWPAFNVADIAIVVGILGLLYVADAR